MGGAQERLGFVPRGVVFQAWTARSFGLEYRARQRAAGRLTSDDTMIEAIDQRGVQYGLPIAVGDKVRLFNRVNASLKGAKAGYFGDNGTVAEVVSIDERFGLRLKRADGVIGGARWESLRDKDTGRIRLSYGSALTIDARQSETLTDHLTLLADGSQAIDRAKAYSAGTRAREDDALMVSRGAEKDEIRNRRPLGDPWLAAATDVEMRQAIMENMARNLSRRSEKQLGVDFIARAGRAMDGGMDAEQSAWPSVGDLQALVEHSPIKLPRGPEEPPREQRQERSGKQL